MFADPSEPPYCAAILSSQRAQGDEGLFPRAAMVERAEACTRGGR